MQAVNYCQSITLPKPNNNSKLTSKLPDASNNNVLSPSTKATNTTTTSQKRSNSQANLLTKSPSTVLRLRQNSQIIPLNASTGEIPISPSASVSSAVGATTANSNANDANNGTSLSRKRSSIALQSTPSSPVLLIGKSQKNNSNTTSQHENSNAAAGGPLLASNQKTLSRKLSATNNTIGTSTKRRQSSVKTIIESS